MKKVTKVDQFRAIDENVKQKEISDIEYFLKTGRDPNEVAKETKLLMDKHLRKFSVALKLADGNS